MAFTTRSPRVFGGGGGSGDGAVYSGSPGPGAYSPREPASRRGGSLAAFLSSAPRDSAGEEGAPGPGAYDVDAEGARRAAPRHSKVPFTSRAPRFPADYAGDAPGPGEYGAHRAWTAARPRRPQRARATAASGDDPVRSGKGLVWLRAHTAPSIPVREQSFGYEEQPSGELRLLGPPPASPPQPASQLPPAAGRAGGARRGVPGSEWSRSKAGRSDLGASDPSVPGPAHYAPSAKPLASERGVGASVFASRSARFAAAAGQGATPGPGAYSVDLEAARRGARRGASRVQCFGSTSLRLGAATGGGAAASSTPGPGAYDCSEPYSLKGARRAAHELEERRRAPFSSTAPRLVSEASEGPGPGAYGCDSAARGDAPVRVGRNASFGSTAPRFAAAAEAAESTAAASATAEATALGDAKFEEKRPSAAFASRARRFGEGEALDDAAPGPGEYDPSLRLVRPAAPRTRMPTSPRFAEASAGAGAGAGVGPGKYDPVLEVQRGGAIHSPFRSAAPRFAPPDAGGAGGPGPGAYNVARSLVKHSWNVTISDPAKW